MTSQSRNSDAERGPREFTDGVYYVRVEGDPHRMVDSDVVEVLEEALSVVKEHYNVRVSLLTASDGTPQRVPLEVRLSVRDSYGRERFYSGTWEVVESEPGAKALTLQTGITHHDLEGVRAQVDVRVGV